MMMLSILLRGTLDEMIEFVYDVYDINGDRSLEREEILMCLEHTIKPRGELDSDEAGDCIRELVSIAMNKLDWDNNGIITFNDYKAAIEKDPLLCKRFNT